MIHNFDFDAAFVGLILSIALHFMLRTSRENG
jgi:hypothetical protein